jgi:demethylmenaquinone methyltransferase/2-methoxy-6-polyprenyl-1,4-benzoquinol methylase
MPVDKSGQRVQRMFGEIAPRYDFLNHLLSLNIDRYWRWRTVRKAPPEGDAPLLDVCCGTGDLTLAYARAVAAGDRKSGGEAPLTPALSPEGRGGLEARRPAAAPSSPRRAALDTQDRLAAVVVGADFCAPMLVRAAAKAQRAKADDRVTFLAADTLRLPFADDTFQIVCVAFGLRNVSDTDAGLREMTRVCRPGGRVVVLEFSMPRWQPFRAVYGWYFRHVLPRIGQWFARNRYDAYTYLPTSVGEFPERQALCDKMQAAGLSDARYHSLTLGVATLYIGRKPGSVGGTQ